MQLVIDVGNTEAVIGVIREGRDLRAHWRISTEVPRTSDEYVHLLRSLLRERGFEAGDLEGAVLGSVVPAVTDILRDGLTAVVDGEVTVVTSTMELPVRLDVEEPRTVGADRVANTLAARELYGRDTIVVDLGTATTFDVITSDGCFQGGVIAPGVSAGLDWLDRRTAKLPRVALQPPETVIGRNTEDCVRSGVFLSAVAAIDGLVRRIAAEWGRAGPYVVATGGFSELLGPHCETVDHVEPFLTLYGLALAADRR